MIVDVTVSHPLAKSALLPRDNDDGTTDMRNIESRASSKSAKYAELARQQRSGFIPFSVDVYGAMSKGAHSVIRY
jgi:hypothetical protein